MNYKNLTAAIVEAERFIERAQELAEIHYGLKGGNPTVLADSELYPMAYSPKESGAVRRASMDLTRALAEMRKP